MSTRIPRIGCVPVLSNLYPERRVILEKLINHETQIPFLQPLSSPWVSYRSKLLAYQLVFSGKLIKNKLICTISISDFNLTQRSEACVRSKCSDILPFNPTHRLRVCVRREYVLAWCSMLYAPFPVICYAT